MPRVSVYIDAAEVFEEIDDSELLAEVQRRENKKAPIGSREITDEVLLDQIWRHFRGKEAPECLREYIYRRLGRVL